MLLAAPQPLSGISATLALIIGGLYRTAAARAPRHRVLAPIIVLLCGRISRALRRFVALAARVEAGTYTPPRRRSARRVPALPAEPSPPAPPRQHLPRGQGWLVRHLPEAAAYGSQLQHLLDQPGTQALLATAPEAGRLLRPLCRMLGVRPLPAALRPPARSRPPARPRPPSAPPPPTPHAPARPPHRRGPRPPERQNLAGPVPTGPVPTCTVPAGTVPAGTGPAGPVPAGIVPAGIVPAGTGPPVSG